MTNSTTFECVSNSTNSDFFGSKTVAASLLGTFPIVGMLFGSGNNTDSSPYSLFLTGLLLMIANFSMSFFYGYLMYLVFWIQGKFYFSLVIKSEDEIYSWIFEFLNDSSAAKKSPELSAHSAWDKNSASVPWAPDTNPYKDSQGGEKRPGLYYLPYYGNHVLWMRSKDSWFKWPVFVNRSEVQQNNLGKNYDYGYRQLQSKFSSIQQEMIRLSTFGFFPSRTHTFLKSIINICMEKTYGLNENKTWIYTPTSNYNYVWKRQQSRSVRSFESVVLEQGKKKKILRDVTLFQQSREWYNARGIPWRRGYILEGPAGTGKTSFITALAGKLKMSIAILSLNSAMIDDAKIGMLMDSAPRNCILVIEDIDVALVKPDKKSEYGVVTLSGLLNALDGIATAEGRILFMTTNHIEKLSSALIRPGRVDMKEYFGFASKSQITELWNNFYVSSISKKENEEKYEKMIKVGKLLGEKIPEKYVSCAELQGFYLLHRFDEEGIIDDIDRFLDDIKKDREKQKKEEEEEEERKKKDEEEEKEKKLKLKSESKD